MRDLCKIAYTIPGWPEVRVLAVRATAHLVVNTTLAGDLGGTA